jgi:hypothetical protein
VLQRGDVDADVAVESGADDEAALGGVMLDTETDAEGESSWDASSWDSRGSVQSGAASPSPACSGSSDAGGAASEADPASGNELR